MNTDLSMHSLSRQEVSNRFKTMATGNPSLNELQHQFEALQDLATDWLTRSPAKPGGEDEGLTGPAQIITNLLRDFRGFFSDYQTYFKRRIAAGDIAADRATLTLRQVNRQTQEQWATLSRLLSQRRYGSPYHDQLREADKQAAAYYTRFNGRKEPDVQPLVYFGKVYKITRFPYQPVPLVAIPLVHWNKLVTDASKKDKEQLLLDRLPLAHELGHYVFWNSADLKEYRQVQDEFRKAIDRQAQKFSHEHPKYTEPEIKEATQTWKGWLEESFADLFGALVAGPAYARNAQDRLVREELGEDCDLLKDDSEHPMPAVRPLLAAWALKHLAGGQAAGERLADRWQIYLDQAEEVFGRQREEAPAHPDFSSPSDRPSPKLLADMVPDIVAGLLTTPALPASLNSEDKISLLESITDLSWLKEEWAKFAASNLPPFRRLPEPGQATGESPRLTREENGLYKSSFLKLLEFAQEQIDRESGCEWDTILASGRAITSRELISDTSFKVHPQPESHNHYIERVTKHCHEGGKIIKISS